MRGVSIGSLRHRVVLEAPVRVGDGGGGAHLTWSLVAELWASVSPAAGSEGVVAEGPAGRISHEIVLRFRDDVSPKMRIRLGSRVFEIVAALDIDERHRMLRCLCREELL